MDPSRNNSPAETNLNKQKTRVPFSESASNREGSHTPSIGNGSRYENCNDHRRSQTKGRERSNERDREWNRDRGSHARSRDIYRGKEAKGSFRDESKPYSYLYSSTTDGSYSDPNHRAIGRMASMSPYASIAPVNATQWPMSLESMSMTPATMTLNPATSINMNHSMDPTASSSLTPYQLMPMAGDPNMYGMVNMGNYGQFAGLMSSDPNVMMNDVRGMMQYSSFVLYPPLPGSYPPVKSEKPAGCKTAYVGGLPLMITEEIIREIFSKCGDITNIRMGKKEYCHIDFARDTSVDTALCFSGYRIRIENKEEPGYSGRLHVNYAVSPEQRKCENHQRAMLRGVQNLDMPQPEYFQRPTPPPVCHYSDHEAQNITESLRNSIEFSEAINTLITWLERGECNKRNSGFFYSMIQSANSQVNRLMLDKSTYEDELNKAKLMLKQRMQDILLQLNEVSKVFAASSVQKVWDHFTKAQRKHIELWKKQTEETKNAHVEEVLNDRIEDEMEINDDDEDEVMENKVDATENIQPEQKTVTDEYGNQVDAAEEVTRLKDESESLKCQLQAYENEAVLMRTENEKAKEVRDSQMIALRQAVQGMQKELIMLRQKNIKDEAELRELRSFKKGKRDNKLDKDDSKEACNELEERLEDGKKDLTDGGNIEECYREAFASSSSVTSSSTNLQNITENEAHLIGLISVFLNVHPFGASLEYTCSYLNQIDCTVKSRDIESMMRKFPTVFKEECTGIGASLEKKWTFSGF